MIERIVDRDAEAFAGLYDRTAPYVFGLLLRMLGDREGAEEVAQEVYMTVWRNAATYDATRGTPATWIGLLARSRAVDRLRSERSYAGAVVRAAKAATSAAKEAHVMPDAPPSPAEALEISERRRLVRAALKELPSEQRRLVELAFFGGLSHSEIARATETPLGTVKSRIRAGIGKLERILRPTHDQRAGTTGSGLE